MFGGSKRKSSLDGRNPFRTLLVGIYAAESNHSRVSQPWCEMDFATIHRKHLSSLYEMPKGG